ncbi:MAG: prepilin-type N-terminal cleavage/methylation domain-containing protein [Planctomycetota bacterium]|jgi:general secretion pathway protein G
MPNVKSSHKKLRLGFSLVELVVVVLIVGILAAVAAPKMFNTSAKAKESATRASLSVVRNAIELYKSEDAASNYPPASNLATNLAPYIKGPFPKSPYTNTDTVKYGNAQGGTEAWVYDSTTGSFWVNDVTNFSNW